MIYLGFSGAFVVDTTICAFLSFALWRSSRESVRYVPSIDVPSDVVD
jgi:hypothetical protein